jgi:hypothetical protein
VGLCDRERGIIKNTNMKNSKNEGWLRGDHSGEQLLPRNDRHSGG